MQPQLSLVWPLLQAGELTLKELEASAKTSRTALLATVRSLGDVEVDETVFRRPWKNWIVVAEGPIPV